MTPDNDNRERHKLVRVLGSVTADTFERAEVAELVRVPESVIEAGRVKGLGEG